MNPASLSGRLPVVAFLLVLGQAAFAQSEQQTLHTLPLVKPASDTVVQGFIRIINHSDQNGTVQIHAIDDSGERFGPITLDIDVKASRHFNSEDLESGNADKGLSGGVGDGDGDWRLELETTLDIEPLAYIRTADGFVTSMHDLVVQGASMRYHVPFFNPGTNQGQVSQLRLINTSDAENEVTIVGLDDDGERAEDDVRITLPAGGARTVTAQELESGGSDLTGGFGDGAGKWHLFVSAEHPVQLVNMLRSPTGNLTNLSTSTVDRDFDPPGFAPADQAAFDARVVGKRVLSNDPSYYTDFVSPGRFREVEGSDAYTGRYTYQNTGPNSGTVEFFYDDGDRCTTDLRFDSATTGTGTYSCTGEPTATTSWRLVDIPPSGAPDLVVESPSVSDSNPETGQSFTLRATVRNRGSDQSAVTTLRYYRSSDATISMSDTEVGTDAVGGLSASDTSAESIVLTAPSSAGTYYYGACVDTVAGESDTGNNCSAAVRVDVSGGSGSCEVTLNRRGPDETVSIRLSDARRVGVGTLSVPVVVHARMDHPADVHSYRIDLREAGFLVTGSDGNLDTEAVLLDSHCTEAGVVIGDVGLADPATFGPTNLNFAAGGDLNAGTYYLVVNEWQGRVGAYSLGIFLVTDSSGAVETGASHFIRGWNSLRDRLESDGIGGQN